MSWFNLLLAAEIQSDAPRVGVETFAQPLGGPRGVGQRYGDFAHVETVEADAVAGGLSIVAVVGGSTSAVVAEADGLGAVLGSTSLIAGGIAESVGEGIGNGVSGEVDGAVAASVGLGTVDGVTEIPDAAIGLLTIRRSATVLTVWEHTIEELVEVL